MRRATHWPGRSSTALGKSGSELRAAALPGRRPQPGDGGYRAVEHGVPGTRHPGLVEAGKPVDGELLQFLSPLGWEHINLTGDYVWRQSRRLEDGKFRPLRMPENLSVRFFRILRAPHY
ncbi:Tn3 family transposase [Citrobacter freundii]